MKKTIPMKPTEDAVVPGVNKFSDDLRRRYAKIANTCSDPEIAANIRAQAYGQPLPYPHRWQRPQPHPSIPPIYINRPAPAPASEPAVEAAPVDTPPPKPRAVPPRTPMPGSFKRPLILKTRS